MGIQSGTVIPFQFGSTKKLVEIKNKSVFFNVKDVTDVIHSTFGVSNFKLYNKKIGFEIPEDLLLLYLRDRKDFSNFVIEIVSLDDVSLKESPTEEITEPLNENISSGPPLVNIDDHQSHTKNIKPIPQDDLQEILDTNAGKELCYAFDTQKRLNDGQQTFLVKQIATHEINKILMSDAPMTISNERYTHLANSIAGRFPNENATTYYHAPFENLVCIASGKLWDEFNSTKCRYLQKLANIRYNQCGKDIKADFPELIELAGLKDDYLKYLKAWQQTYDLRMIYVRNIKDPLAYYTNFISDVYYNGIELIENDFERLHPGKGSKLLDNWDRIDKSICTAALVSNLNDVPLILDMFGDMQQLSCFMIFSYFLENYSLPFRKDNSRNLVIHIEAIAGRPMDTFKKYYNDQSKRKPRVFAVGRNAKELKSYVLVDNCVYLMETIVKAVDFCFKCYHALHLSYIEEQKDAWTLVEQAFYDIHVRELGSSCQNFIDILKIS